MLKYQPFKATSLTASYSTYRLHGNRPNATMPRDGVSFWKNSGSPTWDPMTQTTYINGQVFRVGGPLPNFFQNMNQTTGRGASLMAVDHGVIGLWTPGRATLANDPANPNQTTHFYVNSAPENVRLNQPLFNSQASVSSKDVYDWSRINLAAMNSISDKTDTTTVQLEHIFFNTQRHLLATQVGWMREDSDNRQRLLYGTPGSSGPTSGYLQVDPNIRSPRRDRLPTGFPTICGPRKRASILASQLERSHDQPPLYPVSASAALADGDLYRGDAVHRPAGAGGHQLARHGRQPPGGGSGYPARGVQNPLFPPPRRPAGGSAGQGLRRASPEVRDTEEGT
jgi:hypothetical protein